MSEQTEPTVAERKPEDVAGVSGQAPAIEGWVSVINGERVIVWNGVSRRGVDVPLVRLSDVSETLALPVEDEGVGG